MSKEAEDMVNSRNLVAPSENTEACTCAAVQ
jgi:hypothetical protein